MKTNSKEEKENNKKHESKFDITCGGRYDSNMNLTKYGEKMKEIDDKNEMFWACVQWFAFCGGIWVAGVFIRFLIN
ncbi:MAG: hypothetical protein ACJA0H_000420 [Francisellaceae bacterium]|jgi:hypothetical protein